MRASGCCRASSVTFERRHGRGRRRDQGIPRRTGFLAARRLRTGAVRHFSLPHGLDNINGRLSFDAAGVRVDDLVARLGGGDVRFAGRVALKGFQPGDLNLTATGERMRLRYPEGFTSIVDADLVLRGPVTGPTLAGTVSVRSATWTRRFETSAGLFNLGGDNAVSPVPTGPSTFPSRSTFASSRRRRCAWRTTSRGLSRAPT